MNKSVLHFARSLLLVGITASALSAAPAGPTAEPQAATGSSAPRFTLLLSSGPGQQVNIEKGQDQTVSAVSAQSIGPIDPYVIAGGGGTSTGSNFVLDGTIGQTASGSLMSGATYTVTGGFWNAVSNATVVVVKKRRGQITSQ